MKMKRWSIGLSVAVAVGLMPVVFGTPVLAELKQAGENIVKAILRPEVKLNLTVAKKIVETDAQGKQTVVWKSLGDKAVVNPGDNLLYSIKSQNAGDGAAKNLVVTQPIVGQMVYELGSAKSNNNAEIAFSIDNGKTFSTKPVVKVTLQDGTVQEEVAPAKAYTHVRWTFNSAIAPNSEVEANYQVKVR
jgi:uncharacterized repeat protein (TIGR01451 family)